MLRQAPDPGGAGRATCELTRAIASVGIAHPPPLALTAASVLGHSEAPQIPAKPGMGDGLGGRWVAGAPGAVCEVGGHPPTGRSVHHRNALPDSSWTIAISPARV